MIKFYVTAGDDITATTLKMESSRSSSPRPLDYFARYMRQTRDFILLTCASCWQRETSFLANECTRKMPNAGALESRHLQTARIPMARLREMIISLKHSTQGCPSTRKAPLEFPNFRNYSSVCSQIATFPVVLLCWGAGVDCSDRHARCHSLQSKVLCWGL